MQLLFQVSSLHYEYQHDDVVTDSNWTQTLPALVLLLVRLVLELVLSAGPGPGPAVAADVLRAL